jgi:AcrR family transcriptional regulator
MDNAQTKPGPEHKRRHLPAEQREQQIVEAAAAFFAERGFEGQTRELAKTMGITHSAIFRYFSSKDALIERVYEHVFISRWNPEWHALIVDRTQPLEDRLIRIYQEYAARIFDYQWIRIFVFSGLKGYSIAPRYIALVREQLILPACAELRAHLNLPSPAILPITAREEEAVWGLHGAIFYIAIRKFIYGVPVPDDPQQSIVDSIRVFVRGMPDIAQSCCAKS